MDKENTVISNRQALRDFHIEKTYEAGIQLKGNEVKSLRLGEANLKGGFAKLEGAELFLLNMHISPYKFTREETDPLRPRKLLLNKSEIRQLGIKITQQGYTVIPMKVYFNRGYAKVELGLGKGKKLYDKRTDIKEKQVHREIERALRDRNR
jgi:SsrA-binding protein